MSRLQRLNGILVFGDEGPIGEWHREAQIVKLSERYVAGASTHAAHVAATVVHEAAHARIEESGVRYTEDRRRRIEAICIRAEARFAGRIPGGAELSDYYRAKANRVLADSEERWSNASFRRRDIRALVALDTPRLILRMLGVSAEEITLERQRQQAEALDV